ncbi:MAG: hypothetical protein HEP71_03685 [Roseivirga sp.]|nr:hypothetical protein [Roseivirga sp.]
MIRIDTKIYVLVLVMLTGMLPYRAYSQLTSGINYQAMALDSTGVVIKNQLVRLRFGIVELSTSGSVIFQESHLTTTDDQGIFSLQIGNGTAEVNSLDSVNWQNQPVYLKVEMDEAGGTNYTLIGFVEFASVPYAFHAAYGADEDADPNNELQQLSLNGDTLSISGGNALRLPPYDLGSHIASQNLQLRSFWLSGDGDDEGLKIDAAGTVSTGGNIQIQGISTLFSDHRGNLGFSQALDTNTVAEENVLIGIESGNRLMTGIRNTFLGYRSGQNLTTGNSNVFLGTKAGRVNTTGSSNIVIGLRAGELNETGSYNTLLGDQAGNKLKGSYNTFLGSSAGSSLQSGLGNVFLGTSAGLRSEAGNLNVFLGARAGFSEMGSERLYIENSDSVSPLIYGEFDNDLVRVNGDLDVTGEITIGGNEIDRDSTNELQILTISKDTIFLSNGGYAILPGDDFGSHVAETNLDLNGNWVSGDGDDEGVYIDSSGQVGIGKIIPQAKLDVSGNVAVNGVEVINSSGQWVGPAQASSGVPSGAIVMWSGSAAAIPAGWALCDGTNSTPDLRGRFIVGLDPSDPEYDTIGETGGQKEVTLTTSEIPSHSHGNRVNTGYGGSQSAANTYPAGRTYAASAYRSLRNPSTNYTNTNEIVATGGGQAHENRPPYFALAFIIKQ